MCKGLGTLCGGKFELLTGGLGPSFPREPNTGAGRSVSLCLWGIRICACLSMCLCVSVYITLCWTCLTVCLYVRLTCVCLCVSVCTCFRYFLYLCECVCSVPVYLCVCMCLYLSTCACVCVDLCRRKRARPGHRPACHGQGSNSTPVVQGEKKKEIREGDKPERLNILGWVRPRGCWAQRAQERRELQIWASASWPPPILPVHAGVHRTQRYICTDPHTPCHWAGWLWSLLRGSLCEHRTDPSCPPPGQHWGLNPGVFTLSLLFPLSSQ